MKQLTINIEEEKYLFFVELIKSLDFVQVDNSVDSKEQIIENLKKGFNEMKLYKEHTTEQTTLEEFLHEL